MLFNSIEFIFLFLPTSLIIFFILNRINNDLFSKGFLIVSSLFFYGWWNPIYLPLICGSILFNYYLGRFLAKNCKKNRRNRKCVLFFGILANITLLGYFKYYDFFISNVNSLLNLSLPLKHLILPLAISFFTFQQIAFIVDSYSGHIKDIKPNHYCVFVLFYPQLIAGPIVHHDEMMPQFADVKKRRINLKNIASGIYLFSIGLFKKVVIADSISPFVGNGFDKALSLDLLEAWVTSLSYTFQLYFDFSGYSDMAIGLALLFNIKLPTNFSSPYKASNIQEFWRKWHITLSRFLKNYIYIPLGGNRSGYFRKNLNLMTTFIIGGIWHGAGWTFVLWGLLHGFGLVVHSFWKGYRIKLPTCIAWFITFNFVNICWVLFRAKNWADALKVMKGMIGMNGLVLPSSIVNKIPFTAELGISSGLWLQNVQGDKNLIIHLLIFFAICVFCKNSTQIMQNFRLGYKTAIIAGILFVYSLLSINKASEFLYFNF